MQTSASWNGDYTGYDYTARVGQSLGLIYGYVSTGFTRLDFKCQRATGEYMPKRVSPDISDHAGGL